MTKKSDRKENSETPKRAKNYKVDDADYEFLLPLTKF